MNSCSTKWLHIAFYTECVGFLLSIAANCVLLIAISDKSRKTFGNYKYLMMAFSVLGMFYSTCNFISKPVSSEKVILFFMKKKQFQNVHITENSFIVFTVLRYSKLNKFLGSIAVGIYSSCYAMMLSLLSIHFFYRYTSVTAPLYLASRFSSKSFIFWTLFVVVYSGIFGCSSYFLCGPTEIKDRELETEFQNSYCLKPEEYAYLGPQYYYKNAENGERLFHAPSFIGIGIQTFLMSSTFFFVIFFGCRTYSVLKENGLTCYASKELQKQLFKTLIIQTIIPTIFMYLPGSIMFYLPMFGVKIETMANSIPVFVAIYPCLEPLVAIMCIKSLKLRSSSELRIKKMDLLMS
ncbi:CRE-STR-96 protein [Caenorhabditis remanei]|uniref:Serpentine receptor class r-10 n=1 Tax=Caenorhabditis remanei TaxID=31234 RepID=E3N7G8_CAERE|nr:CRE-STR-96 protein [Caenorhabditis remanei]